ncbi:bifunctional homocysteine S-methyltransferase/methylenetetrahydrofolate reductase, partial [Streptococcus suis]
RVTPLLDEEDFIQKTLKKDTLVDKVKREVTIIAELDPPKTLDIERFKSGIKALDAKGIAAITLADNSLARTRV